MATPLPRLAFGCGSAYANDRLEPAAALADSGRVDYLGFDCLAERTLALAQMRRRADPAAGQDERIGAARAAAAAYLRPGRPRRRQLRRRQPGRGGRAVRRRAARPRRSTGVRIGVIHGDDVLDARCATPT